MTQDQWITLITTLVGSVVGAIVTSLANRSAEGRTQERRLVLWQWILLGAACGLVLGLVIPRLFSAGPVKVADPPNRQLIQIAMSDPIEGAGVPEWYTVRGTYANIPPGWDLWLAIEPLGSFGWFPQEKAALQPVDAASGNWSALGYFYGNVGQQYEVAVFLADQGASEELLSRRGASAIQIDATPYAKVIVVRQ